ncbi:hypothetical protein [Pseudonocardia parietis]|uniref:Uncharacterized protein n=1 Tax=Pseudonocardia parietis TaxID=570936 RepID=A0ABS4VVY8_9PSEU|nr:hypothetical protein [Pseudonocardia parietis]MBP2368076.1 hypothetical protein [Pseudonocardia parietis]
MNTFGRAIVWASSQHEQHDERLIHQIAIVLAATRYYGFSTLLCVPNATTQPGGYALGAQAGEAAIRDVTVEAGFTRFRRAAETPFNAVYEVRP